MPTMPDGTNSSSSARSAPPTPRSVSLTSRSAPTAMISFASSSVFATGGGMVIVDRQVFCKRASGRGRGYLDSCSSSSPPCPGPAALLAMDMEAFPAQESKIARPREVRRPAKAGQ